MIGDKLDVIASGPTMPDTSTFDDAAGAIVDGKTVLKARSLGLNPEEYLDNNDSYNFFRKINSLLITGPTGTNVMDVQIIVVE